MAAQDLVIFALGPVQSFIETSRRTQDLWLSSQLLSHLALVGVKVASHLGGKMLYPVQVNGHWPENIPNRFVVAVPAGEGKKVGEAIGTAVRKAWTDAAAQANGYFTGLAPESGWETAWDRHVASCLETYWVAWHWDGPDYGEAYRRAGLALDARKRIRPFPIKVEPGEKCTLCGIRQALHGQADKAIRNFWANVAAKPQITSAELRDGERLCAICTIKRFADKAKVQIDGHALRSDRFPSTSSIAAASFKAHLLAHWTELESVITSHLDALNALNQSDDRYRVRMANPDPFPFLEGQPGSEELLRYDGDFFFPETFRPERLEEILGRKPNDPVRQRALETLNALREAAMSRKIPPPHRYLTTLALDGDEMGKLLSDCSNPDNHRRISIALVEFAGGLARVIVEKEHPGRLIYAGGDDVLALLPVDHALDTAEKLRSAFTEKLARAGFPDRSASVGIAFIHHMQPLESALRAARDARERAKKDYGRNALVVEVFRRSGERRSVGMKWTYPGFPLPSLTTIVQVQTAIATGDLSGRIAYDVDRTAPILAGGDDPVHRVPPEAQQAELSRLFKRRAKEEKSAQATAAKLAVSLAALAGQVGWREIAGWLGLARFLAQAGGEE